MNQLVTMVLSVVARLQSARDSEDRGATATEYAMLVSFIAIALVLAVTAFGGALSTFFTDLGNTITGWTR